MKKMILLFTLFVTVSLSAFSYTPDPSSSLNNKVEMVIKTEFTRPQFKLSNKKKSGVVVRVRITEDGGFEVIESNYDSEQLNQYTIKKLSKIKDKSLITYAGEEVILRLIY